MWSWINADHFRNNRYTVIIKNVIFCRHIKILSSSRNLDQCTPVNNCISKKCYFSVDYKVWYCRNLGKFISRLIL